MIKLLSAPMLVGDDMLSIGTSIGIAMHDYNSFVTIDSLMRRADIALYEAKEAGRNTYRINEDVPVKENVSLVHPSAK